MKVGIIGAGNMAQALLLPLKDFFLSNVSDLRVYTPTKTRAQSLANQLSGSFVEDLDSLNDSELLILAHKPQQIKDVSEKLCLSKESAIISLLASIDSSQLSISFGTSKVLRLMPNTPAQVGKGVMTYFHHDAHEDLFSPWLEAFSQTSLIHRFEDESLIDLTTMELGSGPGMVLELIRIFSASLVEKGISEEHATKLSSMVFLGSSKLAISAGETPSVLRDKVTSRGGITQECLNYLYEQNLENIFHQAFKAGHNKAIELKKIISTYS